MDKQNLDRQILQLSKLLFDKAANKFYLALFLEILSGIISVTFSLINIHLSFYLAGLIVNTLLLIASFTLKIISEDDYDAAETIRRQTVLSDSLNWKTPKFLRSDWYQKAGIKLIQRVNTTQLDPDYYSTSREIGPARLVDMTIESAFYTRNIYCKLREILNVITIVLILLIFIVLLVGLTGVIPNSILIIIAKVIYFIIPLYLSVNFIGWSIKLTRIIKELHTIEGELEHIKISDSYDFTDVFRLVAEYNCQVVSGIPVHKAFFTRWQNEIKLLWDRRNT